MKTRACIRCSMMRYLVCVTCATIVVAASPVTLFSEDLRENRRPSRRIARTNENTETSSLELRGESPYSIAPGNWMISTFLEQSKESTAKEAVLFSSDKCSRYCIGQDSDKNEDNFEYINLFWSANGSDAADNSLPKGNLQLIVPEPTWIDKQNLNDSKRCQIYLDLDCETVEAGTDPSYIKKPFLSNVQNNKEGISTNISESTLRPPVNSRIVERFNLSGHTQTKFTVDSSMRRIVLNVDGNVSRAVLRVPTKATVTWPGTVISWTRKGDTDGVKIDTRDAPSGEWWMKLTGVDDSNYHFVAEGFVEKQKDEDDLFLPKHRVDSNFNEVPVTKHQSRIKIRNNAILNHTETSNDITKTIDSGTVTAKQQDSDAIINPEPVEIGKLISERLFQRSFVRDQDDSVTMQNVNENSSTGHVIIDNVEYATFVQNSEKETTSSNSPNNHEETSTGIFSKEQKLRERSSIGLIENTDVENIKIPIVNNVSMSMRMIEALDSRELSEELVSNSNENTVEEKKMLIELNRNSNLLVTPGTIHRVVFDVMNSCILPVRYAYRVKSTPFRVYNLQPTYTWIYPGQMSNVAVDLIIPDNTAPDTANTVTLFIPGTEIKEKSVYLYVQGSLSKLTDDVKPKIEYTFNNNCAGKLDKKHCYKSRWSADVTIQDYDSGLKRVISSPNEIYPRTEFVSGTRSPVIFYYSATCCDTTAKVTAIDLLDNYDTYTVDVTVWNNLSEAEIAAITVGALLALLFIIVVVILLIYCFRRRKSHDLPYTQRYGSRSPAQPERTNF